MSCPHLKRRVRPPPPPPALHHPTQLRLLLVRASRRPGRARQGSAGAARGGGNKTVSADMGAGVPLSVVVLAPRLTTLPYHAAGMFSPLLQNRGRRAAPPACGPARGRPSPCGPPPRPSPRGRPSRRARARYRQKGSDLVPVLLSPNGPDRYPSIADNCLLFWDVCGAVASLSRGG